MRAYVKGKRRGKDGLPLKERTRADYLAMVAPVGTRKSGEPFADGLLYSLADTSMHRITAQQIRELYATHKGQQAVCAMQVLRAVLNWHGVTVEGSPLARTTAGRDRIVLPPTTSKPRPIPPERLGAWWRAATARAGRATCARRSTWRCCRRSMRLARRFRFRSAWCACGRLILRRPPPSSAAAGRRLIRRDAIRTCRNEQGSDKLGARPRSRARPGGAVHDARDARTRNYRPHLGPMRQGNCT